MKSSMKSDWKSDRISLCLYKSEFSVVNNSNSLENAATEYAFGMIKYKKNQRTNIYWGTIVHI